MFKSIDSECKGYISITHLLAVLQDIGLKVDLEDVRRYLKRQGLFIDSEEDLCVTKEEKVFYEKLLHQIECAPPQRPAASV